jgi:peptidoglycan/LPS O-acetylase OafA/YrhL
LTRYGSDSYTETTCSEGKLLISKSQSAALDLARGGAAQLVLIGHTLTYIGYPLQSTIQNLGVVMFFIISGFLVTGSAMRRNSFTEFFIDRAARLFTPYLPCLLLILLTGLFFELPGPHDAVTFAANAFMLQDFPLYRFIDFPEFDRLGTGRPLWSVAMEWWFYMAFGGLFFWRSLPKWSLPLVVIGVFIAAFYARAGSLVYLWALGSIGAFIWTSVPKAPWTLLTVFFAYLIIQRHPFAINEYYDLMLGIQIATLMFCALQAIKNLKFPLIVERFATWIAAYSYTLYLIHYSVMVAVPKTAPWLHAGTVLVLSNAVAIVLYFMFERHYKVVAAAARKAIESRRAVV